MLLNKKKKENWTKASVISPNMFFFSPEHLINSDNKFFK